MLTAVQLFILRGRRRGFQRSSLIRVVPLRVARRQRAFTGTFPPLIAANNTLHDRTEPPLRLGISLSATRAIVIVPGGLASIGGIRVYRHLVATSLSKYRSPCGRIVYTSVTRPVSAKLGWPHRYSIVSLILRP